MIKRIITDEIKAEADEYAKAITIIDGNDTHIFGKDSYTQNYVGRIGHIIVREWLVEHKIKGKQGKLGKVKISDDYDFMLEGSDKTIDVKTYQIKYNTNYMLNLDLMYIEKSQTTKVMDYYVDCILDEWETFAYLRGYILRSDVLNNHKVVNSKNMATPGYEIPIGNCGDIRELILILTGKLIDEYEIPTSKQHTFMDIDLSTLPKNTGKVKNLSLMDYTSDYMLSLPTKPKVKQSLMDY